MGNSVQESAEMEGRVLSHPGPCCGYSFNAYEQRGLEVSDNCTPGFLADLDLAACQPP